MGAHLECCPVLYRKTVLIKFGMQVDELQVVPK